MILKTMSKNLLFLFLVTFLFADPVSSQPVTVKIYPEIHRQKIISIGGNYCQANYTDNAWDAVGEVTLSEFKPSHVRIALPLQFQEKEFSSYQGQKINEQPAVITLHETMKRMKEEYGVSNFTVSVWRVADELVVNPERSDKRRIKADKYGEVIDMITAFLLKAKTAYGVEADYFSFNESDGGYMTIFSPEETIRFFKMAGQRFRNAGLKTRFLWADTAQPRGTVEFATMIAADSTIWKDLGPLCFHSWWADRMPDSEFERIAAFAKAWGREVWCNELGFDAMAWKIRGMNASWEYALRFAKISHRIFRYAQVEVSQYWTWQDNYSLMSADTKTKYPSFFITRHYTDFLNRGTQIVHSTISDPDVLVLAGVSPDGKKVLQLINMKDTPVEIALPVQGTTDLRMVTTTEKEFWKEQKPSMENRDGTGILKVQAASVNTLVW
jgi:hypothetical protein